MKLKHFLIGSSVALLGSVSLTGCSSGPNPKYKVYNAGVAWEKTESDQQMMKFVDGVLQKGANARFIDDANESLRKNASGKLSTQAAETFASKILDRCGETIFSKVAAGEKIGIVVGRFVGKENERRVDMDLVNREFRLQLANDPRFQDRLVLVTDDAAKREDLIARINGRTDPNSTIDNRLKDIPASKLYVLTGEWWSEESFPEGSWANNPPQFTITAYMTMKPIQMATNTGDTKESQSWYYHPVSGWITEEDNNSRLSTDPAPGQGSSQG